MICRLMVYFKRDSAHVEKHSLLEITNVLIFQQPIGYTLSVMR